MLTTLSVRVGHRRVAGFSLIELMVALVVGLVVIGAVLALILAVMRSNNQTILATRLTQELRATAAVIAADLRRAGGVDDPMTVATANAGRPLNPFADIDVSTPGCILYAYANAPGGNFHAISLSNGSVLLAAGATRAAAPCGAGQRLNSDGVDIDTLEFNVAGRRIDMTIAGALASDPEIRRTYTQTIFVRSVPGS